MDPSVDARRWAAEREDEGWSILAVSDHIFMDVGGATPSWFPHVWVTAAQMAAATTTARLMSTYANNLLRSPVEFVQASLSMQLASCGRWDAGLGAGWNQFEMNSIGEPFPSPRDRADRYIEAVQIVRRLFDDGACEFNGDYYSIAVPKMPGFEGVAAPRLVGALGGPRTIAGAGPFLDRIEIKASSISTQSGRSDPTAFASIPRHALSDLIDLVRRANSDAELAVFARCGVDDDPRAQELARVCVRPGALYTGLFGPAAQVAERLAAFAEFGVTHVNVSPTSPSAFAQLAPYLFG
jgi:alkanesulfonate monooxygenase SsuD/methylene tetrahydromethanopterin reductase-like flavin-dependent oxidoreductase (luciferase family)